MRPAGFILVFRLMFMVLVVSLAWPATFLVVTNTNDSGAGSLRQAILDFNANVNLTAITFNIPGAGVQTITPLSALPAMTHAGVLDGTSQPGWAPGVLVIQLTGTSAGPSANGLSIQGGNTTVQGLVINGFSQNGIVLQSNNNTITGNFIGTNAAGNAALANGLAGVQFNNQFTNIIGGTTAATRNVISGNGFVGIEIAGGAASGNVVEGNFIGTDVNGTAALANNGGGVLIQEGAGNNTIGGVAAGARNIISGNASAGVAILGGNYNRVQGNYIGTDVNGMNPLGNQYAGVFIDQGASNNTVGVSTVGVGAPNLIAFNATGVVVTGNTSTGNTIEANAIFSNTALGIDLGGDGVTPNDSRGHTGPNNFQNFPVLTSAQFNGGTTTVIGSLNSTPNTPFHFQLFQNQSCDPSGFGQGQTLVSEGFVTTNGAGNGVISTSFSTGDIRGLFITAIATDPTGNTSEFSACREVDYTLTNAAGRNLRVRLGQPFTLVVASFTDTDPNGSASEFSTTSIDWGDGTPPSTATIVPLGSENYNVMGTHAYTKVGSWNVTVTIKDSGGASAVANSKVRLWPKAFSY